LPGQVGPITPTPMLPPTSAVTIPGTIPVQPVMPLTTSVNVPWTTLPA
jgi:hypothetical protein